MTEPNESREEGRGCICDSRKYFDITMSTDIVQNKHASSNGSGETPASNVPQPATTRGGLRVYKIVVLGDGGVGKSGAISMCHIIFEADHFVFF